MPLLLLLQLLVNLVKKYMNLLFQGAVFAFIIFSLFLVIGVPVIFASASSSTLALALTKNKTTTTLLTGLGIWFLLVCIVGILNSFVV